MKFIDIGDIHASGFSDDSIVDESGLPSRLHWIKTSLNQIVTYGRSIGIYHYILDGDIYNDKTIIYNTAQDMLANFFITNSDCHFYLISGNHDFSSTGELQKSAISVFQKYPNVTCYLDEPFANTELGVLFVPYSGNFIELYKKYKPCSDFIKIIVAHLGLNEGVLQSGLSKVDKVRMSDIADFPLALLGHYHKPQMIQGTKSVVYYAGSLIPKDWNDKNENKRFLVVDNETLEVQSIDITGVPGFHELIIQENATEEEKLQILNQAAQLKSMGNQVRVRNKSKTNMLKSSTRESAWNDVLVLEQQDLDITNRGITVTQTKMEQVQKYLEIKGITGADAQRHLDVLQKYHILGN